MSNTRIQIKRSTVTGAPPNGSLNAGELAYSYVANTLYIGTANSLNVEPIAGRYYVDTLASAYNKANAANVLAYNTGIGANAHSDLVGTSANLYAQATFYPIAGGTISGDVLINGNLTIHGATTYTNTTTLLVGDSMMTLNADLPITANPTENAGMEVNRGAANSNSALIWNEAVDKWQFTANIANGATWVNFVSNTELESLSVGANSYATQIGASSNAYANTLASTLYAWANLVGVSANSWANTVAGNGSLINTGLVSVPYGGTGNTSFTAKGVLYGNGTGALGMSNAPSAGQVLQYRTDGVKFGGLDGGTF